MSTSIYGEKEGILRAAMADLVLLIETFQNNQLQKGQSPIYDHILYRLKSEDSMRQKCRRKGLPETEEAALHQIRDALGIRIVCRFIDDIDQLLTFFRHLPNYTVVEEKDYIRQAKPNGYRSYHLILATSIPELEKEIYLEIQLRTIAMDTWASLEHEMKYKQDILNPDLITKELKRCADELASCDLSMQTLRRLIQTNR